MEPDEGTGRLMLTAWRLDVTEYGDAAVGSK